MTFAIVKKELRENLPAGAVAFVALSIGFMAGFVGLPLKETIHLPSYLISPPWQIRFEVPILSPVLLTYTTVLYAIFGAALGLMQTLLESLRGTYPLLLHRPVSRGKVFLAKVAGGAALYVLAGGLPLAVAVVWAAIPGNYAAPFRIGMAGAVFADFLCGFVFYLAAFMVGTSRARWYGTRLAPAVVALAVMIWVHSAWTFTVAFLVAVGGLLLLFWGSWAAFVRRDF